MNKIEGFDGFAKHDGTIKVNFKDFSLLELHSSTSNETHKLRASEATRNILITGETGSGKTTSTILPMIHSLIHNDCPGLILDIKSDLYLSVHVLAEEHDERLVFIGLEDFCEPINILSSVKSIDQFKNILISLAPYNTETTNNGYFFNSGVEDVIDIVKIHSFLSSCEGEEYQFDLALTYKYIVDTEFTKSIVDRAYSYILEAPSVDLINTFKRVKNNSFSLYTAASDDDFSGDAANQREWRSGQIASILGRFCNKKYKEKLFNSNTSNTIKELIYEQNKIIIFCMPFEEETNGFYIAKMLRELYFKAVTSNKAHDLENYKIGSQFNRYTFLAIDEYQFYVNTDGSHGVITDDKWLSISRSFGNINIFATQSLSSIASEIGESKTKTIVQNFANSIFLKTNDPHTHAHARFLTGYEIAENLLTQRSGRRLGVYKLSSNGGSKIDCFDISKNKKSNEINSPEFNEYKIHSSIALSYIAENFDALYNIYDAELEDELNKIRSQLAIEEQERFEEEERLNQIEIQKREIESNIENEYSNNAMGEYRKSIKTYPGVEEYLSVDIVKTMKKIDEIFEKIILVSRMSKEERKTKQQQQVASKVELENPNDITSFEFEDDGTETEKASERKPFFKKLFGYFGLS